MKLINEEIIIQSVKGITTGTPLLQLSTSVIFTGSKKNGFKKTDRRFCIKSCPR